MGIIYVARNKHNGKIYVGQTTRSLSARMSSHRTVNNGMLFGKALRKYGDDGFDIYTLSGIPRSLLDWFEITMIAKLESIHPGGYNLATGGRTNHAGVSDETKEKHRKNATGRRLSEVTRMKISRARKGAAGTFIGHRHSDGAKKKVSLARMGATPWNKGTAMSNEAKQKASEALKGRSPTRMRPVYCVETGECFLFVRDVQSKYGYCESNIASAARGKLKSAYGKHWAYMEVA